MTEENNKKVDPNHPNEKLEEMESRESGKSLIEQGNDIVDRMEKANEERRKLLEREEALETQKALGGRSRASVPEPEEPKEMTNAEYAQAALEGRVGNKKNEEEK